MAAVSQVKRPNNHLAWSIITTVLCCQLGGIVAIVYSAKVDSLYNAGDYIGADNASQTAKNWNIGSMIVGGIIGIIYMGAMIFGVISGMSDM